MSMPISIRGEHFFLVHIIYLNAFLVKHMKNLFLQSEPVSCRNPEFKVSNIVPLHV